MTRCDFLNEAAQCLQHVAEGLPLARLREEGNEVNGMPFVERYSDLGVLFEAPDAGTMSRTRIDYDDRRLGRMVAGLGFNRR